MESIDEAKLGKWIRECLPKVQAVWLFGSFATHEAKAESDVDLGVLLPFHSPVQPDKLSRIRTELAEKLGRSVDLIDLRKASTVLQNEVVSQGRCILELDPTAKAIFEMENLSRWQKLNEERRGILEEVYTSGRILSDG